MVLNIGLDFGLDFGLKNFKKNNKIILQNVINKKMKKIFSIIAIMISTNPSSIFSLKLTNGKVPVIPQKFDEIFKVYNTTDNCQTQTIDIGPFAPSCNVKGECIVAELDSPVCNQTICSPMKMKLQVTSVKPHGTCCRSCTCYGDPHCESFYGKKDTWIMCDARVTTKGKDYCSMSEAMCNKQIDFYGNPCQWIQNTKKWNVGLLGSPCVSNSNPILQMYKFNDFALDLTMGERSTIINLDLRLKNKVYSIPSQQCILPNWMPNIPNEIAFIEKVGVNKPDVPTPDYKYTIYDRSTKITLIFTCTKNFIKGTYGIPRINVDYLMDPENPELRPNSEGFCINGTIYKGKTYDVQRTYALNKVCKNNLNSDEVSMARAICGPDYNQNNYKTCIQTWCDTESSDPLRCMQQVNQEGWQKTWCAVNTLSSQNTNECTGICDKCVADMNDFGFIEASNNWDSYVDQSEHQCLQQLDSSVGPCGTGIELQYFKNGNWITYGVIPEETSLCPDVVFNSDSNPELFNTRIRLKQCPSTCEVDQCKYNQGFRATIKYKAVELCKCEYESVDDF